MKLFESGSELQAAIENLSAMVEAGDMTIEEMGDNLAAIEGEFDDKVDSCLYALKNLQARAEMMKTARVELQAKERSANNQADRLKSYIRACMIGAGKTKAGGKLFTASVSKGRSSVVVDNMNELPAAYKLTTVTETADKKLIKAAMDVGMVPGAHIEEGEAVLRIK
jgi:chromosome segregation ATPase